MAKEISSALKIPPKAELAGALRWVSLRGTPVFISAGGRQAVNNSEEKQTVLEVVPGGHISRAKPQRSRIPPGFTIARLRLTRSAANGTTAKEISLWRETEHT